MVGGGPAGLACAHRLALLGHEVIIYEAREKLSGLNEYGIGHKTVDGFAQIPDANCDLACLCFEPKSSFALFALAPGIPHRLP